MGEVSPGSERPGRSAEGKLITVPAVKLQQFDVTFYLLNLAASDVERLVRFEVLGYDAGRATVKGRKGRSGARVNWELLEERIQAGDGAYQRPIIKKKIEELVTYYRDCRSFGRLPAIPGPVLLTTDVEVEFSAAANPFVGTLQLPEEEGSLRALDGQHRLLALSALVSDPTIPEDERQGARRLQVPAVLFERLAPDVIVEMFVTINAKHTRLNPSHLISLAGKKLYADEELAAIHQVVRDLNETESSPLYGAVKMLGVGTGKVPQAALAAEMKTLWQTMRQQDPVRFGALQVEASRFFLNYFKQVANAFEAAWNGRKYSIKTGVALRAFIRVVPAVIARASEHGEFWSASALASALEPWERRIGSARFETDGQWRAKVGGSPDSTTRLLARELESALTPLRVAGGAS